MICCCNDGSVIVVDSQVIGIPQPSLNVILTRVEGVHNVLPISYWKCCSLIPFTNSYW